MMKFFTILLSLLCLPVHCTRVQASTFTYNSCGQIEPNQEPNLIVMNKNTLKIPWAAFLIEESPFSSDIPYSGSIISPTLFITRNYSCVLLQI